AAAVLIFCSQLHALFGFKHPVPVLSIPSHLYEAQPLTILIGVITCVLMLKGARVTRIVPPTILGLLAGVATYYFFASIGLSEQLGPVIGPLPFGWPTPQYLFEFGEAIADPQHLHMAPLLVAGAVSLAIVASLDGLLCARLVEADSGQRVQGNPELIRLGVGNMISASFGGIANG